MIGLRSAGLLIFSEPGALESSLYLYLLRWQMRVMTQVGTLEQQGHWRQRACTFIFTGIPLPSHSNLFGWLKMTHYRSSLPLELGKWSETEHRQYLGLTVFGSNHALHVMLSLCGWIAQHDRMPSRARLFNCGLCTTPNCCLCDSAPESRDHLLLRCEVSEQI